MMSACVRPSPSQLRLVGTKKILWPATPRSRHTAVWDAATRSTRSRREVSENGHVPRVTSTSPPFDVAVRKSPPAKTAFRNPRSVVSTTSSRRSTLQLLTSRQSAGKPTHRNSHRTALSAVPRASANAYSPGDRSSSPAAAGSSSACLHQEVSAPLRTDRNGSCSEGDPPRRRHRSRAVGREQRQENGSQRALGSVYTMTSR